MSAVTPTIRRASGAMPMNFITPSVHVKWRLSGSCPWNICCARPALMMTTFSAPRRSRSLKSRPATIGIPSAAKKPGDTERKRARGSSWPFTRARPSTENWKPSPKLPASRHGTVLPKATRSTPGTAATVRCTSR